MPKRSDPIPTALVPPGDYFFRSAPGTGGAARAAANDEQRTALDATARARGLRYVAQRGEGDNAIAVLAMLCALDYEAVMAAFTAPDFRARRDVPESYQVLDRTPLTTAGILAGGNPDRHGYLDGCINAADVTLFLARHGRSAIARHFRTSEPAYLASVPVRPGYALVAADGDDGPNHAVVWLPGDQVLDPDPSTTAARALPSYERGGADGSAVRNVLEVHPATYHETDVGPWLVIDGARWTPPRTVGSGGRRKRAGKGAARVEGHGEQQ